MALRIEDMVQREVNCCLSSLVSTLANSGLAFAPSHAYGPDICDLAEQALELASPVLDYEEAVAQAGWESDGRGFWFNPETGEGKDQDLEAEALPIEPYECEVYEHWSVSNWLAEKLIAQGEKVDTDFAGMNVWARTTTGQQISGDSCIQRIYEAMMAPTVAA